MHMKTRMITECGIMLALSTVLSFIKVWEMPMGGSVTLVSMLPLMLIGIKNGNVCGLVTAFLYSLVQLFMGIAGGNVFVYCKTASTVILVVLFDYIIPFTVLGLCGALKKITIGKIHNAGIYIGMILTVSIRFLCHFITGFSIWGQWAPEGMGKYYYSLIYNGTYLLPELVITGIASVIILRIPQIRKLLNIKSEKE